MRGIRDGILLGGVYVVYATWLWSLPPAYGQEAHDGRSVERWECWESEYEQTGKPIIVLRRFLQDCSSGACEAKVMTEAFTAEATVSPEGLDLRWDWDFGEDGRSDSMLLMKPTGRTLFFNFRGSADGSAKPSDFYWCRKAKDGE